MPVDTTTYSVGWFALSLINAGLAQSKNRSGLVWWLLSLLLGPFATFLIVVSPKLEPGQEEGVNNRFVLIAAIAVLVAVAGLAIFLLGAQPMR